MLQIPNYKRVYCNFSDVGGVLYIKDKFQEDNCISPKRVLERSKGSKKNSIRTKNKQNKYTVLIPTERVKCCTYRMMISAQIAEHGLKFIPKAAIKSFWHHLSLTRVNVMMREPCAELLWQFKMTCSHYKMSHSSLLSLTRAVSLP